MAELSIPWSGTVTGDAGPYSDDDWSDIWRKLFTNDRTTEGVFNNYANELEITGAASPIAVDTGAAFCDGKFYENDSVANIVVPTPAVNPRIDRIVIRKSWVAQTCRLTRIEGVEGGGAPAITQNDGTTWDVPLYQLSIATITGAITLTDERSFIRPNIEVDSTMVVDLDREVELIMLDEDTPPTVEDGIGNFRFIVPLSLNGYNLKTAHAAVNTVSNPGTPTFQIYNLTQTQDMLSTAITIDATERTSYTATTPPVVNGATDDVATGDEIRVDCDVVGTGTKGLVIILTFETP